MRFEEYLFFALPVTIFVFQQFPTNWWTWGVAFVFTLPAYYFLAGILLNAPVPNGHHGEVSLYLSLLILPAVLGSISKAVILLLGPRLKGALLQCGAFLIVSIFVVGSIYWVPRLIVEPSPNFPKRNGPQFDIKPIPQKPLPKIE